MLDTAGRRRAGPPGPAESRFTTTDGAPITGQRTAPNAGSLAVMWVAACFGSSLNVHPRDRLVVLDGVFSKADDSEIEF